MAMTHRLPAAILALLFGLTLTSPALAAAAPSPLRRDSGTFLGVLDSLNASILTIVATPNFPAGSGAKKKRLIGTGVAASRQDVVTTASLAFPNGVVRVLIGKGVERRATLRGVDRQSNIAVFHLDEPVLTSLRRAAPQSLAPGTWVAVISNVAVSKPQAALGQVVGRGERVGFPYSGDVLEIDAPSYPGLAGGAVLNEDGEWVAMVVGRGLQGPPASGSRVGMPNGATPSTGGVLLAVPVDQVDRIVDDLVKHGSVQRGFLGIRLKREPPLPGDTLGVRVDGVIPGSPAAAAGIRRGDRILQAEKILELSIVANEVTGKGNLLATKFDHIAYRAWRVAWGVEHPNRKPFPVNGIALLNCATHRDRLDGYLRRLLSIIVKTFLA